MGWISWLCPGINLKRWLAAFLRGRAVLCYWAWHYFSITNLWDFG